MPTSPTPSTAAVAKKFLRNPPQLRRKPPHKSLSVKELDRISAARASFYRDFEASDKEKLAKRYTPAQLRAIELGEQAIDPADLADQARTRYDILRPKYLDDFSRIHPGVDKSIQRIRGEGTDYAEVAARDNTWREAPDADKAAKSMLMEILDPTRPEYGTSNESGTPSAPAVFNDLPSSSLLQSLAEAKDDFQESDLNDMTPDSTPKKHTYDLEAIEQAERQAFADYMRSNPAYLDQNKSRQTPFERLAATLRKPTVSPDVAPKIPMIHDQSVRWEDPSDQDEKAQDDETALAYVNLSRATGKSIKELRAFRVRELVFHTVVNQTRLGKIRSFYCLSVAGNENGLLGIGEGKAAEADEARRQAALNAIREMVAIRRYEKRTIFGEVKGKMGAVKVRLTAKPPGFGLRVSSHIHEMARCAGITDLASKLECVGRNPMNVVKAVWEALKAQKDPEDVARGRGKKMVDVRKVYYAGVV